MAAKKKPVFDYGICIACGICVQACPVSTLELQKTDVDRYKKAYPEMAREGCIGCGFCATNCPLDAVTMCDIDSETGEVILPEKEVKNSKKKDKV
jgi:Formate hydrogenlyase subunit 6/NADH:ubiquinone oxidoreductase 23 kD subunit (chain I)